MDDLRDKLAARLAQYGTGTYASRHEVLGMLAEEMHELTMAVHTSPLVAPTNDSEHARLMHHRRKQYAAWRTNGDTVRDELLDLAVAALFSIACIDAGTLAW